jgi:hypothetical protein
MQPGTHTWRWLLTHTMLWILCIGIVLVRLHPADAVKCYSHCPANKDTMASEGRGPSQADMDQLFKQQKLLHCHSGNKDSEPRCRRHFNETVGKYQYFLRDHFESLAADKNHSVNRINKNAPQSMKMLGKLDERPRFYNVQLVIDARCYHSWTINPYHRIADCMMLILPTLYHYIENYIYSEAFKESQTRMILLVDESTEQFCVTAGGGPLKPVRSSDSCLLSRFQNLMRNRLQYQCISTSIYFASGNWYRKYYNRGILTDQFVMLQEQNNPFTYGSGFDTVLSHPNYGTYLNLYRNIVFDGFSCYCKYDPESIPFAVSTQQTAQRLADVNTASTKSQNLIVFLKRTKTSGRYIPQTEILLTRLKDVIDRYNEQYMVDALLEQANSFQGNKKKKQGTDEFDPFELVIYSGHEKMCTTVAIFWAARVIIGAHGAGIINTIYSRPNTLLIEISPDKIDNKGVPWRANSAFASLVGVHTHVVVVPHNASAKTDRDIQVVYPMSLTSEHIDYVGGIVEQFLGLDGTSTTANASRVQTQYINSVGDNKKIIVSSLVR